MNVALIQTIWTISVLSLSFDILSTGVCTTRHWQTSGQMVEEFNVCIVVWPGLDENCLWCTVATFNSCTKCARSTGIMHDSTPDCNQVSWHGCMDGLATEYTCSFGSQVAWVIMCLTSIFWHVVHGCLYNRALTDVRSPGVGIKCLYCSHPCCMFHWNLCLRFMQLRRL